MTCNPPFFSWETVVFISVPLPPKFVDIIILLGVLLSSSSKSSISFLTYKNIFELIVGSFFTKVSLCKLLSIFIPSLISLQMTKIFLPFIK